MEHSAMARFLKKHLWVGMLAIFALLVVVNSLTN
jgi:hypothetical protein